MLQIPIMVRSITSLFAGVLISCASVSAAAAQEPLPAPYQIDGAVRFKSDRCRLDDGLGLKGQTAFGLLYRAEDGWRGLFRPRDYALLC